MNAQPDGTLPWPHDLSPVERVALKLDRVLRALQHIDAEINELVQEVERLRVAARGGHE